MEGAAGFEKLIIPLDFCAENQTLETQAQSELRNIVDSFQPAIEAAIGYGSGILPQDGYGSDTGDRSDTKQLDFIFLVKDSAQFHRENLQQNPGHYSAKSLMWINLIQGKGIFFNPYVSIQNHVTKYGVVDERSALMDLSEWSSLYFAGRMQKPVNYIKEHDVMVKFLNQYNLKNAMTIAIFLIQSNQFSERELYEQITSLSYLGDFRMYVGGENPNKVRNIVSKQFHHFRKLYQPILDYFIHRNYLILTNNDDKDRTFKTNLNASAKIKLISCLPLKFRTQLYSRYPESSIKEIATDRNLAYNIKQLITRTIIYSSVVQAIKGVFASGMLKSMRYALAKRRKNGLG
ncbi:uncharacterized protein LODBEIA_P57600 [Lodderomyces beijingensis]|uniref:Phosphatidate cytidylyltransferase, mitochondrial n=1 Tax=Lodderomyces beijingensis TaxID=1775926 RepID=A0ABP0ZVZ6_9ASCO